MTLHQIRNNEHRKKYYFKVVLICFLCCAYFFALTNFVMVRMIPGLYNLGFGILFTAIYFFRNRHFDNTLTITAIFYQIFFFGHSFFLLPGKQLEGALGLMTCLLPIFVTGFRLWFFFITNFILFHIVLFNVGYGDIFYFQYLYYLVLFIIIYTILNENRLYEKELLIQQDKIHQDAKQLKELDELKTRFFANISHELRTPLTLLLSPIQSLLSNSEFSNKSRIESKPIPTTKKTTLTKKQLSESDLQWLEIVEGKILNQIGNSNFKLSDLADELFMTSRTLQLKIKNLTGQTPKQYQRNIQLHEARKILKSGKIQTVSELSYQLGFEDQHYLSGLYKKQFGVTPKEELARL